MPHNHIKQKLFIIKMTVVLLGTLFLGLMPADYVNFATNEYSGSNQSKEFSSYLLKSILLYSLGQA